MGKNKKKSSKNKASSHEIPTDEVIHTNDTPSKELEDSLETEGLLQKETDPNSNQCSPQVPEEHGNQLRSDTLTEENDIADKAAFKTDDSVSSNPEQNDNKALVADLARVQEERDQFELQYNTLLSRLSSMKTVFSKMKESQAELETCQEQLREYESQNLKLNNKLDSIKRENHQLQSTVSTLNQEISSLNRECETLSDQYSQAKHRVEALEEQLERSKSDRDNEKEVHLSETHILQEKIRELTILLDNSKQDMSALSQEVEDYQQQLESSQEQKVQLEKSLKEIEDQLQADTIKNAETINARDTKIRELQNELKNAEEKHLSDSRTIAELDERVQSMSEDLDKKKALEQECKERVLQIGKLRHEAIILNEHLTKALAMLKQSNDSENVDKELISNLLISFVSIPRGDPKKFEVLELISSFLSWDDDKKQQAGLIHSANGLRVSKTNSRTENFVSLWTEFLEKESEK
ncbi:LAFE_0G09626g1_1 [Lachancea fermentati]|uniref:LAFE_0G09626g1_1 n=1 Tax=Lachancea fermentati TaxID=4955 RepID=A0A1G4MHT2_LACFM|nr:LAFE_0G09626g1_1 [Lachancea fermentati]